MLVNSIAYLFKVNTGKLVLEYYCQRKKMQEKYDKLYGKRSANNMIVRIKNKQLRHRIFQASFRGLQRAII